jgi:hypothetical protein
MQNWLSAVLIITIGTVAYFIFRETRATNKRNRMNTLLTLLQELGEPQSRHNREIIYDKVKRYGDEKDIKRSARTWAVDSKYTSDSFEKSMKAAIEDVTDCLDRLGFYLMRVDPQLKRETPEWIWTIAQDMWSRLGDFIKEERLTHPFYGKYFEELHKEAEKQIERLKGITTGIGF